MSLDNDTLLVSDGIDRIAEEPTNKITIKQNTVSSTVTKTGSSISISPQAKLLFQTNQDNTVTDTSPVTTTIDSVSINREFTSVLLSWVELNYSPNTSHIEIWRNTIDNVDSAVCVGDSQTQTHVDTVEADKDYYYWFRAISLAGVEGVYSNSILSTSTVITEGLETYLGLIALRDQINQTGSQFNQLLEAGLLELNQVLTGNLDDNINLIQNIITRLDGDLIELTNTVNLTYADNFASITSNLLLQTNDRIALAERIEEIAVSVNTDFVDTNASIRVTSEALASTSQALTRIEQELISKINTDVASAEAKIVTESQARVSERDALVQTINALTISLDTEVGNRQAAIIAEQEARATAYGVLVQTVNSISAGFTAAEQSLNARIDTEALLRVDEQQALATSIENLRTSFDDQLVIANAAITQQNITLTNATEAFAQQVTTIESRYDSVDQNVGAVTALITSEATTRAGETSALAQRIDTIEVTGFDGSAYISRDESVTQAFAQSLFDLGYVKNTELEGAVLAINGIVTTTALANADFATNTSLTEYTKFTDIPTEVDKITDLVKDADLNLALSGYLLAADLPSEVNTITSLVKRTELTTPEFATTIGLTQYTKKSEIPSEVALITDLIRTDDLTAELADYILASNLEASVTSIDSIVKRTELNTPAFASAIGLTQYVKTTDIPTEVALITDIVREGELTTALADYVASIDLESTVTSIASLVKRSELSTPAFAQTIGLNQYTKTTEIPSEVALIPDIVRDGDLSGILLPYLRTADLETSVTAIDSLVKRTEISTPEFSNLLSLTQYTLKSEIPSEVAAISNLVRDADLGTPAFTTAIGLNNYLKSSELSAAVTAIDAVVTRDELTTAAFAQTIGLTQYTKTTEIPTAIGLSNYLQTGNLATAILTVDAVVKRTELTTAQFAQTIGLNSYQLTSDLESDVLGISSIVKRTELSTPEFASAIGLTEYILEDPADPYLSKISRVTSAQTATANEAKSSIKVDANGRVVGFGLTSNLDGTKIEFRGDTFELADNAGVSKVYFDTVNNKYVFKGEVQAESGTFSGRISSSRVDMIGSSFMKVENPDGFGQDNLWYWFGAKIVDAQGLPNYNLLTKDNAREWKAVDGTAQFNGTLSPNIYKNSAASTTVSRSPSIEVDTFTTVGNTKRIILEFNMTGTQMSTTAQGFGVSNNSFTVQIQRRTTGSYQNFGTPFTFTGQRSHTTFEEEGTVYVTDEYTSGVFETTDGITHNGFISYRLVPTNHTRFLSDQYIISQILTLTIIEEP